MVVFPAPGDVDPASWKPDLSVISEYQEADLILLNGANYAKWTRSATLPRSRLINTSAAAADLYIEIPDAIVHQHGPGGEHSHPGLASTIWLDPSIAIMQVEEIRRALARLLPEEQASIDANAAELITDLETLDSELTDVFAELGDRPLLFAHPVYQYLAQRYGINGVDLRWQPDQAPSETDWAELESIQEGHSAEIVLWSREPAPETVRQLEGMGIRSVVYSPCGERTGIGALPDSDAGKRPAAAIGRGDSRAGRGSGRSRPNAVTC